MQSFMATVQRLLSTNVTDQDKYCYVYKVKLYVNVQSIIIYVHDTSNMAIYLY